MICMSWRGCKWVVDLYGPRSQSCGACDGVAEGSGDAVGVVLWRDDVEVT